MSNGSYSTPMPAVPEPEPGELDPQASLIANSLIATAEAYLELAMRLRQIDYSGEASDEELAEIRAEASTLTARAAQLMKEVRVGLNEHAGHDCDFADAYGEVGDFLGVLLESGAGLLELRRPDQIDSRSVAHPFAHLLPLLAGPVHEWLLFHVDEESRPKLVSLRGEIESMLPADEGMFSRLIFGPVSEPSVEGLRDWYQGSSVEPEDELCEAILPYLLELNEGEGQRRISRIGEHTAGVVLVEGNFDPDELWPLLGELEERTIPYRVEDEGYGASAVPSVTIWTPGMSFPLERRALLVDPADDGILLYQLDGMELERLRESDADLDDVASYLELTFEPGMAVDDETLEQLDRLSKMLGE